MRVIFRLFVSFSYALLTMKRRIRSELAVSTEMGIIIGSKMSPHFASHLIQNNPTRYQFLFDTPTFGLFIIMCYQTFISCLFEHAEPMHSLFIVNRDFFKTKQKQKQKRVVYQHDQKCNDDHDT